MKRNIISEVNRMRQIMGLELVLEQTNTTERIFVSLLDVKKVSYIGKAQEKILVVHRDFILNIDFLFQN